MRRGVNPCIICGHSCVGPKEATACPACRSKVRDFDRLVAERAAASERVELPRHHVNVYPFGPDRYELEKHLQKLFQSLPISTDYERATAVQSTVKQRYNSCGYDGGTEVRLVPAGLGQAFADLLPLINNTVQAANETGHREGVDLLARLNAGELTTPEFERRAGISKGG